MYSMYPQAATIPFHITCAHMQDFEKQFNLHATLQIAKTQVVHQDQQ